MSTGTEILAEVEALKAKIRDTRDLYREVCAVLFFRHGITPTANKLYQYVRRGSMNVPTEELAKFWDDMRHKARVTIELPDLPEGVQTAAAEAIAALWRQAAEAARAEYAGARLALDAEVEECQRIQKGAERAVQDMTAAAQELNLLIERGQTKLLATQTELENERRDRAAEQARLHELRAQLEQSQAQQRLLQEGFSADLEKAREAVTVSETRAAASERRALIEIEQERQARQKAEKTTEALRQALAESEGRERQNSIAHTEALTKVQFELNLVKIALKREQEMREDLERGTIELRQQFSLSQQVATSAQARADTLQSLVDQLTPGTRSAPANSARTRRQRVVKEEK